MASAHGGPSLIGTTKRMALGASWTKPDRGDFGHYFSNSIRLQPAPPFHSRTPLSPEKHSRFYTHSFRGNRQDSLSAFSVLVCCSFGVFYSAPPPRRGGGGGRGGVLKKHFFFKIRTRKKPRPHTPPRTVLIRRTTIGLSGLAMKPHEKRTPITRKIPNSPQKRRMWR